MLTFLKGIVVGMGGIAPGLSGTALLIIFGMYRETLDTLGNLFDNFLQKLRFLLPLIAGMFIGVLLFSKLLNYLLNAFPMQSRFCFLGMILGTLPMVWKEVKKEGFSSKYILCILAFALLGTWLFTLNPNTFPQITEMNFIQSILLGVAVAATAIIPGMDPAVVLSSLGIYEMYVTALAGFDLSILIPMVLGLAVGAIGISRLMSILFRRVYTLIFSCLFGLFVSMIPNILNAQCIPGWNMKTVVSLVMMILGFFVSYILGTAEKKRKNNT